MNLTIKELEKEAKSLIIKAKDARLVLRQGTENEGLTQNSKEFNTCSSGDYDEFGLDLEDIEKDGLNSILDQFIKVGVKSLEEYSLARVKSSLAIDFDKKDYKRLISVYKTDTAEKAERLLDICFELVKRIENNEETNEQRHYLKPKQLIAILKKLEAEPKNDEVEKYIKKEFSELKAKIYFYTMSSEIYKNNLSIWQSSTSDFLKNLVVKMNNSYFYLNDSCMEQYDKNELIKFIKSKGKFDDKKTYEFIKKGLKRKSILNNGNFSSSNNILA